MLLYPLTIFLGAFLLFQVQPLIAKHILPWYGGGPGVWTACMLFFQIFLLLGYCYAHAISRLSARRQAVTHLSVLGLSLAFASIAPSPEWKPSGSEQPTLDILLLLSVHVGIPFATLASTSPLVMRWFSLTWPRRSPFRLYALSNLGSLLALLSYPFIVEPMLSLTSQEKLWSIGYVGFVFLCGAISLNFARRVKIEGSSRVDETDTTGERPGNLMRWLALSATGCILLLATTNQICQDLTVVPMLWILPLAIYLLSFIICFDRETWYQRTLFLPFFALSAAAATWALHSTQSGWIQISIFATTLFAGTMVCHGELVRTKPAPLHLTRFYLAVSAGGALGGIFVGVLAPRLFLGYWEYPLGLLATGLLAMHCVRRTHIPTLRVSPRRRMAWAAALAILSGVAIDTVWREVDQLANAIETTRSFFGITRVENRLIPPGNTRVMRHGRIAHGSQFTSDPLRREPTAYFGRTSGVGVAFRRYRLLLDPPDRGLRVGIVGLGAGTLAAYGRDGDLFRFYEIDSEVERIARNYFAYIQDSSAEVEVLLGDARLTLARATVSEEFDILILDAFTGDAVPVHLLTREAYQIYLSHLRPGGLLVFQVSNRYLDLGIVVRGLAEEAGQETVSITTTGDLYVDTHEASYVIATNNREFLADPTVRLLAEASPPVESAPRIWTDAFASLWTVMADRHWGDQWDAAPNLGHFVVDRGALLTIEDEIRVKTLSQALYAHSGGKSAMVVITAPSLQAGGAGQTPLPEFVSHLFQKVGLASPEITDGLLVFISEKDRQAGFLVSPSWPAQLHEQLSRDFNNHTLQALAAGESSRGITDFAERFDHLVRTKMAGEAHYLQGEPL